MEPFITIGIASYNYAAFLPKAFEAIKKQSFKDYEILYCDDGSSDNSVEVINGFINDNPEIRIRLITGKNMGVIANKKRIIDNAYGKYIMLCDADDFMEPDCLSELACAAERTNADRVISQFRIIDSNGNSLRECDIAVPSNKWLHTLWHGCLFKRSIFGEYPLEIRKDFLSDDYYMIMHYNLKCKSVEFVYKTLYNNVAHGNNATTVRSIHGKWKPKNNFQQVLHYTYDNIYIHLEDELEKNLVVYQVTKFYYQALLTIAHVEGGKELLTLYQELRNELKDKFPKYLHNDLLTLTKENYDRKYGRSGLYLMSRLEKMHMLYFALQVYHRMNLSLLIKDVKE